jgi:voltage-gated potassium channel
MNNKLLYSAILLLLTVITGIAGYMLILGHNVNLLNATYMTVITLSTVGFSEIIDFSNYPLARLFTMFLILIGMGNLLFFISTLTSMLVEGGINNFFWRQKMKNAVKKLDDHYIICGAGNTGIHIIKEFIETKKNFVVVEINPVLIAELKTTYPKLIIIEGDCTTDETLEAAGITRAKGLAAGLTSDKDNLFLIITARQLNPKLRIISKVVGDENQIKLLRAGANALVSPNFIGAMRIASELVRPHVVSFLDTMLRDKKNIRVEEITIPDSSWMAGKQLQELQIPQKTGLQVIAVKEKNSTDYIYNPEGKTILKIGTTLFVIGNPKQMLELESMVSKN